MMSLFWEETLELWSALFPALLGISFKLLSGFLTKGTHILPKCQMMYSTMVWKLVLYSISCVKSFLFLSDPVTNLFSSFLFVLVYIHLQIFRIGLQLKRPENTYSHINYFCFSCKSILWSASLWCVCHQRQCCCLQMQCTFFCIWPPRNYFLGGYFWIKIFTS